MPLDNTDKTTEQAPIDRGDDVKSPLDNAGKKADGKPEGDGKKPEDEAGDDDAAKKGDKLDADADEGDETPEEKAAREKEEAEAAKKRNIRIPKARFDEAQQKARAREAALLEQIEELKGGKQIAGAQKIVAEHKAEIDKLQDKYEDLILDGKKDDARKLRKQIEQMREELVDYQTSVKSDAARKSAIEELSYQSQLASFESKYAVLNPESDAFDEDKTNEVASLLNVFAKAGTNRSEALKKAVKYVLGDPPSKGADSAAEGDEAAKKAAAQKRAEDARKKAAEADKKQPPNNSKVGLDSDKAGGKGDGSGIDVMRLSQDRFAKLDEETKAKLRGDELA